MNTPRPSVRVHLGERSYDVVIVSGDPDGVGPFARERSGGAAAFVVADANTRPHAAAVAAALGKAGLRTSIEIIPSGESQKSLSSAARLYDCLIDLRADRR